MEEVQAMLPNKKELLDIYENGNIWALAFSLCEFESQEYQWHIHDKIKKKRNIKYLKIKEHNILI